MASRPNRDTHTVIAEPKKNRYTHAVSACLAGIKCTFKSGNHPNKKAVKLFMDGRALAVCPEVAGGMGVPRERSEICGGTGADVINRKARIISVSGEDVTSHHISGAKKLCAVIRNIGIKKAILRPYSPACGTGLIYDGTFSGKLRAGDGVFAAMLKSQGVKLCGEKSAKPKTKAKSLKTPRVRW